MVAVKRSEGMAEKARDSSDPLDVQKIHYLVRLMKRYDLTDLNINDGHVQIRLKRRGPESAAPIHMAPMQAVPAAGTHPGSLPGLLPPRRFPLDRRPPPKRRAAPRRSSSRAPWSAPTMPRAPGCRSVCNGRLRRPAGQHRLYHRGHEGLHRYSRGGLWRDRRDPGQERTGR